MNIMSKSTYTIILLLLLSGVFSQCKSDTSTVKSTNESEKGIYKDNPAQQTHSDTILKSEYASNELLDIDPLQKTDSENLQESNISPALETKAKPKEKAKSKKVKKKKEVKQSSKAKKKPQEKKSKPLPQKKIVSRSDIKFDKQIHDWDTITEGDKFDVDFVFTNTGKSNLEIYSASATCGCTQPSFPFIDIPPGGKSKIGVKYNSVGKDGDEKATISVKTNVREEPFILFIEGNIKPKDKTSKEPILEKEKLIKIISVPDTVKNGF